MIQISKSNTVFTLNCPVSTLMHLLLPELSSRSAPELKVEDLLKRKPEVFPTIQISYEERDDQQEHVSFLMHQI